MTEETGGANEEGEEPKREVEKTVLLLSPSRLLSPLLSNLTPSFDRRGDDGGVRGGAERDGEELSDELQAEDSLEEHESLEEELEEEEDEELCACMTTLRSLMAASIFTIAGSSGDLSLIVRFKAPPTRKE